MNESLDKISKALGDLIQNPEARIYTHVTTGYDETGMFSTADGYLRFAKELIEFVVTAERGDYHLLTYGEVQGPGNCSIGDVFNPISEVELDSALLLKTEEEVEKAIRFLQTEFPE